MSICAQCGFENAPGRKFCGGCGAPLALTCTACGAANEPGTRFCGQCGVALTPAAAPSPPAPAPPVAASSERRVVSVLFADLVGFTPLSESRDAEEVRDILSSYFDRSRRLIEIYGGTVEKFIGDAVMAVWGTPVAQEDDAERAVRTALDLVEAVEALGEEIGADLQARAGVLTGEAAVTYVAAGESMVAGDLVNTAARIQTAAEPGSVLVGGATKRASNATISYEEAGSFELKGKSEPLPLFRAVRVMSRRRGTLRAGELEPPFVGRHRELDLVKDLFHATAEDGTARLVSVIGVGGLGKSRLAWELEKYLDGVADTAYWHHGRCLAYGDGVAYWALAEMVRMRALISEEDSVEEATAKLSATLDQWFPDSEERAWVEPRLQQLLSLCDPAADERQNLFAAWRLFFERLAERGPVILVFEDLQWADASLLDFIEHLLDWSRAQPIFVLALTRPELYTRRPSFGAGATTLSLAPLSEGAMGELLDGFVPGLPDDLTAQILERAEGVPLYAVETVRMLLDRSLVARDGDVYRPAGPIEALDVPETLHALVAARLDGLSADERGLLQDAAVLGKSFTKPGLAALSSRDDATLDELLTSLIRKEVLSVQADPRSPERGQYAFVQDLLKRVGYETLSRPERKARHLAAAAYLEQAAGAETELVDVIAAHYLDAYQAAPNADDAAALRAKAGEHLALAGERAAGLAAHEEAQRYFENAAALTDDDLVQARMIEQAGHAAFNGARYPAAVALLERAIDLLNTAGKTHAAARLTARVGLAMWREGDLRGAVDRLTEALEVLADDEPDAEIADLIATLARLHYFLGEHEPARQRVERALEIGEALSAYEAISDALNTKNLLLLAEGRYEEARALLYHAIKLGREHDLGFTLLRALNNQAVDLDSSGLYAESARVATEGAELARRIGFLELEQQLLGFVGLSAWMLGNWDTCDALLERLTAGSAYPSLVRATMIIFTSWPRGRLEAAKRALAEIDGLKDSEDAQLVGAYRQLEGLVLHMEGRPAEAAVALRAAYDVWLSLNPRLNVPAWGMELEALADANDTAGLEERVAVWDRLPMSERTPYAAAIHERFRGRLLAAQDDAAGAVDALGSAARQFADQGLRFYEAATLVECAEAGGPSLPAAAVETLERLEATPWLARAESRGHALTP